MRYVLTLALTGLSFTSCGFVEKTLGIKKKEELDEQRSYKQIHCEKPTVRKIDVPLDPSNSSSAIFTYSYEFIPGKDSSKTIIGIPGGPGQTGIGSAAGYVGDLAGQYNVIMTDPRGVGCNHDEAVFRSASYVTSQRVAEDILAVIKKENLKDYSVIGISYGTVVATMVASLAEKRTDLALPTAVILEGVDGKAAPNFEFTNAQYEKQWQKVLNRIPGAEKAFSTSNALPLGFSTQVWSAVIHNYLMAGTVRNEEIAGNKQNLLEHLIRKSISNDKEAQEKVRQLINRSSSRATIDAPGSDIFYSVVACREVFLDLREFLTLQGGKFRYGSENRCQTYRDKVGLSLNAYDSANWPVTKTNLYYFNGEDDPATPMEFAQYHYDSQKSVKQKTFVTVLGAGHNPLHLSMDDCLSILLKGMMSGQDIKPLMNSCQWKDITVQQK